MEKILLNLIFCMFILATSCLAQEKKETNVWKETNRPPRENFQPETKQISFDLKTGILKNPAWKTENPKKDPYEWEASARIWENVYKSPNIYADMVSIEEDPNVPFLGKPSVKVSLGPSEKEILFQVDQKIDMSQVDLRGKKLRLTFYAYREKPPVKKEFWVVAPLFSKKADGNYECKASILEIHPQIPIGVWTRFSQEGTVYPETDVFCFSFRHIFSGKDTIWLSGFLLEVIQ